MTFVKGNKLGKGRPKTIRTQARDWLEEHPTAYEELMDVLYKKALQGDDESAKYVIDRLKGKAAISIDQRTNVTIGLTADDYARERLLAVQEGQKLLTRGDNGHKGTDETEEAETA